MRITFPSLDGFARNILIVFAGTSVVNAFNLFFQLYIAHALVPADFAAFNALIAALMIVTAPLNTLQIAVTKFCAEWNALGERGKTAGFLKRLLLAGAVLAAVSAAAAFVCGDGVSRILRVESAGAGVIVILVFASTWLIPIVQGGLQGLELFGRLSFVSVAAGMLKLACSVVFVIAGYRVAGALAALLAANVMSIVLAYLPLRRMCRGSAPQVPHSFPALFRYLIPVAVGNIAFTVLVSSDMVLAQRLLARADAGTYAVAQMVGKVFLFLPGAVSMVMFPRSSGMNARDTGTRDLALRSIKYVAVMCCAAAAAYFMAPEFLLKMLTGKSSAEAVALGRVFAVSMSCYAVVFLLFSYFLSIGDNRFLKYLAAGAAAQCAGIVIAPRSPFWIQGVVCAVAVIVCLTHLMLLRGGHADKK